MDARVSDRKWRIFDYFLPIFCLVLLPTLMTFFWLRLEFVGLFGCLVMLGVPQLSLMLLVFAVVRLVRDRRDVELKKRRFWWVRTAAFCISPFTLFASIPLMEVWQATLVRQEVREGQINESYILGFFDTQGRLPTTEEFSAKRFQRLGRWEYEPILVTERDGFVLEAEMMGAANIMIVGRVPEAFNRMSGEKLAPNWTFGMRASAWEEHLRKQAEQPDQK